MAQAESLEPIESRDSLAAAFVEAGYLNVRSYETEEYRVYSIENDYYTIPVDGIKAARSLVQGYYSGSKPIKLIMTRLDLPELTMNYNPASENWTSKRSVDQSWNQVRHQKKTASSFGRINIILYPRFSFKNLIINQVYQTLWQIQPTLEMSLWSGAKFSYQLVLPLYNDGYNARESLIHPGIVSFSQSFRPAWLPGFQSKITIGSFSSDRYGVALDARYYFPNERFSLSAQFAYLGYSYWEAFRFRYEKKFEPYWKVYAHYYSPMLQTNFSLGAQKFLLGDMGLMYEMTRHFHHTAVSLYAQKSKNIQFNVGFKIAFALPPFKQKRHSYLPKLSTSGIYSLTYIANNEKFGYKTFRSEPSESIMFDNQYNPFFIDYQLSK